MSLKRYNRRRTRWARRAGIIETPRNRRRLVWIGEAHVALTGCEGGNLTAPARRELARIIAAL